MKILSTLINKVTNKEEAITPVIPGNWFTSKEHYLEYRAAFSKYTIKNDVNSSHLILHATFRNRDWLKGWTVPTNPNKLIEHEAKKKLAMYVIASSYSDNYLLAPFDGTVTTEMFVALKAHLKETYNG